MSDETEFIRLFVAAERKFLGYLVTMLPTIQDAEEMMQETSIVLWKKFDEFLATQTGTPDVDRFVAWGCRVAFYKTLNWRRQQNPARKLLSEDVMESISNAWLERQGSNELSERRTALAHCVEKLPPERRDILREYYWKKQTVETIAEGHRRTTASVYKIMQRTRVSLHKCIKETLAH